MSQADHPIFSDPNYLEAIKTAIRQYKADDLAAMGDTAIQALMQNNKMPEAYYLLGLMAFKADDPMRAVSLFEKAHQLDGDCIVYSEALANVLARVGKVPESLYYAKLSSILDEHPLFSDMVIDGLENYFTALDEAENYAFLTNARKAIQESRLDDAYENCRKQLEITSDDPEAFALMGDVLFEKGHFDNAASSYSAAIHLSPDDNELNIKIAKTLAALGNLPAALSCLKRAEKNNPQGLKSNLARLSLLGGSQDGIQPQIKAEAAAIESKAGTLSEFDGFSDDDSTKIRIGLISDSFRNCSHAYFIDPMIRLIDKSKFEIFCYQDNLLEDALTSRFQNMSENWTSIYDIDDETLKYIIKGDQLDLLIDLTFDPANKRLVTLLDRPAPVILAYHCQTSPATSIAATHVLSDACTAEADEAEILDHQVSAKMASPLLTIDPANLNITERLTPALNNKFVSYGSHLDLARLNYETIRVWSEILREQANANLILCSNGEIGDALKTRVVGLFSPYGVIQQIQFMSYATAQAELELGQNLNLYNSIDIYLNPFPASQSLALCHAIWSGAPVVTLQGTEHRSRVGSSIVTAAGKEDWICTTEDDYIDLAVRLGNEILEGKISHESVFADIQKSALFDSAAQVKELEKSLASLAGKA